MVTSFRAGLDRPVRFLLRMLLRMAIGLAVLVAAGLSGYDLGSSLGFRSGSAVDWELIRIERELTFKGTIPVDDLAPGSWAQACLFGVYQLWEDAPVTHRGSPPWLDDYGHVTLILVDAAGSSRSIRLPWPEDSADSPNCVPVGKDTKLVAKRVEGKPWVLHVE